MSGEQLQDDLVRGRRYRVRERVVAAAYGLACHVGFGVAIASMVVGLWSGMTMGFGRLGWPWAPWVNALLLFQFPILHSLLLSDPGRRFMSRLAPGRLGAPLSTTTFATISSIQILAVFVLWTPSKVVWWQPEGLLLVPWAAAFGASWLLLLKAMWDSGLGVQTGFHGWGAVARGQEPPAIPFRKRGLFRYIRQPIYVAFGLTLWTGPVWTPDHLAIALAWTAYCVVGPVLKEMRYLEFYGDVFREYRDSVPYWFPVKAAVRGREAVR